MSENEGEKERYHEQFTLTGRIPTKSSFFQNWDKIYTSKEGIYEGLHTVLGEQLVVPNDAARAPIYKRFLGRPMHYGDSWMERFVKKITGPTHFAGKATAEQSFGWYDTTFNETVHKINFSGVRSISLTDDVMKNELNMGASGDVNDYIVDFLGQDIQRELESMAGTTLVSQIKNVAIEDLKTPEKIRDVINKYAIEMKEYNKYAEVCMDEKGSLYAKNVVAIMRAQTAFSLTQQPAVYPNAGVVRTEAEILPLYSTMPSGVTTGDYAKKAGDGKEFTYEDRTKETPEAGKPPGFDRGSPTLILLDAEYFEIRPYINEWSLDTCRNAKGRFTNVHAVYKGAMGIKPWRSAICINSS